MSSKRVPIWHVVWHDAAHPSGAWQRVQEAGPQPLETISVGHVVFRDRKQIRIAAALTKDSEGDPDQYTAEITIPRNCIISIEELRRDSRGNWTGKVLKPASRR